MRYGTPAETFAPVLVLRPPPSWRARLSVPPHCNRLFWMGLIASVLDRLPPEVQMLVEDSRVAFAVEDDGFGKQPGGWTCWARFGYVPPRVSVWSAVADYPIEAARFCIAHELSHFYGWVLRSDWWHDEDVVDDVAASWGFSPLAAYRAFKGNNHKGERAYV